MAVFTIAFETDGEFVAEFQREESFDSSFDHVVEVGHLTPYEGEYSFTPTNEVQIIPTQGLTLAENLEIQAIPSNYGKVSWNGAYLKVE